MKNDSYVVEPSPGAMFSGAHNQTTSAISLKEIIKRVFTEGYIDYHLHGCKNDHQECSAILVRTSLGAGNCELCPTYENTVFSVNPFYISKRDGKVHLSQWSVGGTVDARYQSLEDAVNEYNKSTARASAITCGDVLVLIRKSDFDKKLDWEA